MRKKGLLALETLVVLIISVIALFFILKVLMSFLLTSNSNEQIAISNAMSIKEFVDNSLKSDIDNCFNFISLNHLSNFQVGDYEFVYIIDNLGVSLVSSKNLNKVLSGDIENIIYKKIYFSESVNLFMDETSQGNFFTLSLFFWDLNGFDKKLILKSLKSIDFNDFSDLSDSGWEFVGVYDKSLENVNSDKNKKVYDYFLLIPEKSNKNYYKVYVFKNSNLLLRMVDSDVILAFSKYFKEDVNLLFFPAGDVSKTYISSRLCSIVKKDIYDQYNKDNEGFKSGNFDYVNKKIHLRIVQDDNFIDFMWKRGKLTVYKNNNEVDGLQLLDLKEEDCLDFHKFIEKFNRYYDSLVKNQEHKSMYLELIDSSYIDLADNAYKNTIDLRFEDLFIERTQTINKSLEFVEYHSTGGLLANYYLNVNNCKENECVVYVSLDNVDFADNIFFFFNGKYYAFKPDMIYKIQKDEGYEYFFNGKKIDMNFDEIKPSNYAIENGFNKFTLNIEGLNVVSKISPVKDFKEIDVLISKKQRVLYIPEYNRRIVESD